MSEQIDWSKAPEWAIGLGLIGAGRHSVWFDDDTYTYVDGRQMGGRYAFSVDGFHEWSRKGIACVKMRPTTQSWSGEGIPPVGVVCDVFNRELSNPEWEKCTILFAGKHRFLYDSESCAERCGYIENLEFRPIRTPEQIAADEREAAVKDMMSHIYACLPRECWDESGPACFTLYDAGYRKP